MKQKSLFFLFFEKYLLNSLFYVLSFFVETYMLFCLDGETERAKDYIELFCKRSGTDEKTIRRWIPLVAAAQSVNANKTEREALLSMVSLADYE